MDFFVFAPNPWRDIWRNRQQLFSRLAGPHRVLYVEPARSSLADWRRGRVSLADLRRPALVEERPNLWLYRIPAWLPTRGAGDAFDRVSDALLAFHLRRTLRKLSMVDGQRSIDNWPSTIDRWPLLWLYRPTNWRWAAESLPHKLLVYHITDDYSAFGHLSPAQRAVLAAAEQELLAAADLTIVTAPRLLELKRPHAKRIELIPNGVDYEAFQRALSAPKPLAALLQDSSSAQLEAASYRLGYSGHISKRLDLPLLRDLALARPGWTFLFAGSEDVRGCEAELAALKALPNVHFLGVLPVEDVPHFIAACDACLIPYRIDDETRSISSLKLYEYLAAGKPVVSARVPAAEECAAVVRIADEDRESWLAELEAALAEAGDPIQVAARQAVARANTWEERVGRIEGLLMDV